MTELYIDGLPVALPKGFEVKVKEQNPLITKNGKYTLDLTLSLKEGNNAKLYRHIDRLHSTVSIANRRAVLVSDGKIIINGTEAVISNTNEDVKIQLLSGNSELNYFINSEVYISELDLGSEPPLTAAYVDTMKNKRYPQSGFCTPKVKIDATIYNGEASTVFRMQPFLVGMIEKVIKALGYTISENELLDDHDFCSLFFLNNYDSTEYNRMLPGWTAKAFIEECEKFLNVAFDISSHDRSVKILRRTTNSRFGTYAIGNVIDQYERTFDSGNSGEISYVNVKYNLPSSTWYKYTDIDEEILRKAEIIDFATYDSMATFLSITEQGWIPSNIGERYYKSLKLFRCEEMKSLYIVDLFNYQTTGPGETYKASWCYLRPINQFRKIEGDLNADFISLEFVPAQMTHLSVGSFMLIQTQTIPLQSDKIDEMDDESNIRIYIENGLQNFNSSQKKVNLAFYAPLYMWGMESALWGAQIDYLNSGPFCSNWKDSGYRTLRLEGDHGLHKRLYQVNTRYDTTKEYVIKFITRIMPDVRAEFLLNNKLFVCKELEYRIGVDGVHSEAIGTFYEIK